MRCAWPCVVGVALASAGCLLEFDRDLISGTQPDRMAASAGHTCALDVADRLWCWGDNRFGQLGRPGMQDGTPPGVVPADAGWTHVAAGGDFTAHTCGIQTDGSLWCWGTNTDAELGIGPPGGGADTPTLLNTEGPFRAVGLGTAASCGVSRANELYCWGWNGNGRLGLPADVDYGEQPIRLVLDDDWHTLAYGQTHGCGIRGRARALWCWGINGDGQLGRADADALPAPIDSETDGWRVVSAGAAHTCAVRTDGSLWCWGSNDAGQLGGEPSMTPVPAPRRVAGASDWIEVAAGLSHTCARRSDRSLWCWGSNDVGQLGLGGAPSATTPTRVDARNDWDEVIVGYQHSCGRTSDGTIWCWGGNGSGQLGNGSFDIERVPTEVQLIE